MKEEWIVGLQAEDDKKLARFLGITYSELSELDHEWDEVKNNDDIEVATLIRFNQNVSKEILAKIKYPIDKNNTITLNPWDFNNFVVSARKYRPFTFDTVIGQSHVTTTLKNSIRNNQIAHAFLFCGPRGVGKTTCARILAKTVNCENITSEGEACDNCKSCISFQSGDNLCYFELDAASNNSVDNIRELVDKVRIPPQGIRYKVYVIDEVHMLSSSAFNAFLKTLEEPPHYAIFILATTEKHKILPTILSRCQIFDFKRITTKDIITHLQDICDIEGINADKASLQIIAQKSEGCMRDALSILDKIASFTGKDLSYSNTLEHLNLLDSKCYFELLDCMQQQDLSGAMLLYDDINRKGFEGDLVVNSFAEFIRNLLVCKDEKAAGLLEVVESFKDKYISVAKNVSPALLISALNILNDTEINYKSARNKRLHVELALIKLCYLQQAIELSSDASGINKKKIVESAVTFRTAAIKPFEIRSAVQSKSSGKSPGAKLIIETGVIEKITINEEIPSYSNPVTSNQQPVTSSKLTPLDKIRKQYQASGDNGNGNTNHPLQDDSLQKAWSDYVQKLKEAKNSAALSFEMALLRIKDDNSFEAVTTDNIQKQFIEQDRNKLFTFLQERLQNRLLQFNVIIEEQAEGKPRIEILLTAKEQFLKMAEQYPMVKELKDRLRLELDY